MRDWSKFIYKGKPYNKGKLVNKVVKDYVAQNPSITFSELEKVFLKDIQGSTGIFDYLWKAEEIYNRTGYKRFYINPKETIRLGDNKMIATCNQWNWKNISDFIQNAKKLGFDIEKQ